MGPRAPRAAAHTQVGAVRDYLGVVAIHALELRRQEAAALLLGAGVALVDVDAQEQVCLRSGYGVGFGFGLRFRLRF